MNYPELALHVDGQWLRQLVQHLLQALGVVGCRYGPLKQRHKPVVSRARQHGITPVAQRG